MSYEVKLDQFNGPLNKLLELIENKELDITQVSLATVTGDFIHYVEGVEAQINSVVLSDFVVVASRLLLIKSKVLLPNLDFTEEEEIDIADLERRLKIYRALCSMRASKMGVEKSAAYYISSLWNKGKVSYGKKFLSSLKDSAVFYPSQNLEVDNIETAMRKMANLLEHILPETTPVEDNIITLGEKIEELVKRLNDSQNLSFNGSFKEEDKAEIVILFLAVLHMLSARLAEVDQIDRFGEIKVLKVSAEKMDK